MREYLYRGKRVDNGKWEYGFLLQCRKRSTMRTYIVAGSRISTLVKYEVDPCTDKR